MYRHGKLQAVMAKLERSPDAVADGVVRLMCLGKLFNEFGFEVDQVVDYVVEAEHQDGPPYWAKHFLVDNKVDYGKLVRDMQTYLEVSNASTG